MSLLGKRARCCFVRSLSFRFDKSSPGALSNVKNPSRLITCTQHSFGTVSKQRTLSFADTRSGVLVLARVDEVHRIGLVFQVHVQPVGLVSLSSWVLARSKFLEVSATFYGLTSVRDTASCPFRCKPSFGKKPTYLTVSWFRS